VKSRSKAIFSVFSGLTLALAAAAQQGTPGAGPPHLNGFFPLSQVHRGLRATAWTVFTGTVPEPMDVEILGVLKGARGPGQDMILAQLLGAKPEYTGVVAGMSGSPVYVGDKLLGSLSYRIGQFSKDPIAGITPIAQMLEVRDLPLEDPDGIELPAKALTPGATIQAMDTPLVMSGFAPDAVRFWQKQLAGTPLAAVSAGGIGGGDEQASKMVTASAAGVEPGSAVSAQLVRGDMEISATCTVTYIDPKQLLACGHPILQSGPVSLPMTTADVVATLASPLNAFKIINTGVTIGAFTEDRDSAIRGILGQQARMIPVDIHVHGPAGVRNLHVDILNLESLTAQALMVVVYNSLLQTNESTAAMSYHLVGKVGLENYGDAPIDVWAPADASAPAALTAALQTGLGFQRFYGNDSRQGPVTAIDLDIDAIPHHVDVSLDTARLVSSDEVHAGDTVMVEATLHPWHQPARNVRIPVQLPARLEPGSLRLLVSDSGTLDRALLQPRANPSDVDMRTALAEARLSHAADRVYVSLLLPESQAELEGDALATIPLSVANALEPMKSTQDANLNGESAVVAASAAGGGVVKGFTVLTVHVMPGGGLN
jgi:hypothetical protein